MLIPFFYKSDMGKNWLRPESAREGIIFQMGYKDGFSGSSDNVVEDKITGSVVS
jgi:hypothetical protein